MRRYRQWDVYGNDLQAELELTIENELLIN